MDPHVTIHSENGHEVTADNVLNNGVRISYHLGANLGFSANLEKPRIMQNGFPTELRLGGRVWNTVFRPEAEEFPKSGTEPEKRCLLKAAFYTGVKKVAEYTDGSLAPLFGGLDAMRDQAPTGTYLVVQHTTHEMAAMLQADFVEQEGLAVRPNRTRAYEITNDLAYETYTCVFDLYTLLKTEQGRSFLQAQEAMLMENMTSDRPLQMCEEY